MKGLRKVGARTLEQANEYLAGNYLPLWERRFSQPPRQAGDAHRPLEAALDLDSVLSRVEQRMVAQDYTVRWQGETYQIPRPQIGGGMRGSRVAVEKRLDGNVWMRWKQRRVRLDPCPLAIRASYRVDPVAPPAAVAKPNAAERARRRLEARRKADEAFHRLPDRPLWQVLRDEARGDSCPCGLTSSQSLGGEEAQTPPLPRTPSPLQKRNLLLCTKAELSTLR